MPRRAERGFVSLVTLFAVVLTFTVPAPAAMAAEPSALSANSAPVWRTVSPRTSFDLHGVRQGDSFAFTAAEGPVHVRLGLHDGESFLVVLEEAETQEVLVSKVLEADDPSLQAQLPRTGRYNLAVGPMLVKSPNPTRLFELAAGDLEMPGLTVPGLTIREIKPLETLNQPFDLEAGLIPPSTASRLAVLLDEKLFRENILGVAGAVSPVRIDPATLSDGIHILTLLGQSEGSENRGALVRPFFVDRVDSYTDLPPSHWARKPVEFMSHLGILEGRGDGRFDPEAPVTRAEFAKMVAMSVRLEEGAQAGPAFVDIPEDHWARPHIEKLAALGLLQGEAYGGRVYAWPDRTITRAEAITIIGRIVGVADADLAQAGLAPSEVALADRDAVPDWALPSVILLRKMGWISGFSDGTFGPARNLNRDQAAKILARFLGL